MKDMIKPIVITAAVVLAILAIYHYVVKDIMSAYAQKHVAETGVSHMKDMVNTIAQKR